jgi:DNA processing protein
MTDQTQEHAAALAGLPGMTPVRLSKLLDGFSPALAWQAVRAGTHPADPRRKFTAAARRSDVDEVRAGYDRAGVEILLPGWTGYPSMLIGDPGAPAVLFALGDPTVLEDRPRVAIVGTRSATHYGRQVASELAADLVAEGVVVVSGLARGIDGAAHAGALRAGVVGAAPPVAVVGTGLDIVYPSSNTMLWEQVAARGAVFSESAMGTKPRPGVFPARNRIIAALSDVVVIVESHHGGGSLYTADAAARRSIPVCAVPGSVMSRASAGTNALLVDGCTPVRDATDVLVAISLARTGKDELRADDANRQASCRGIAGGGDSLAHPVPATKPHRAIRASNRTPPRMSEHEQSVFDAVDDTPTTFETILIRTDLSIATAAAACDNLVERGVLSTGAGWWSRARS